MEPAELEVTESEAEVSDPEGVGWGLLFEEPLPGEPEEPDVEPQPGKSDDAARASAP